MKIPLVDLKAQYRAYKEEIDGAIQRVLDSAAFIGGEEVEALETELSSYVGVRHAVTCASGTDALVLSLMALRIGAGDEVITTPFTFAATAGAIALRGATPVFADIDKETFNIDAARIEPKITERTKAIVAVGLFGQPADFDEINAVAARHSLPVIEDGAQSFGARYKGTRSCALSGIGCTSFFPSKPLGGYGDGGAVFTDDPSLALKLKELRRHGLDGKGEAYSVGLNSRLDAIQAAILRVKLRRLDDEIARREEAAARYGALLAGLPGLKRPVIREGVRPVFAQYSILVPRRDAVVRALRAGGISVAVYYETPVHLQPAYAHLGHGKNSFPVAEETSREVMSLPMGAFLAEGQQAVVAEALRAALETPVAG